MMESVFNIFCDVKVTYKNVKLYKTQFFVFFSKEEAETFCKNVEKLYYVDKVEICKYYI